MEGLPPTYGYEEGKNARGSPLPKAGQPSWPPSTTATAIRWLHSSGRHRGSQAENAEFSRFAAADLASAYWFLNTRFMDPVRVCTISVIPLSNEAA